MLKEKVTELMDRYEDGIENLTANDVLAELETIMDEYGDNSDMDVYLSDTIRQFVWTKHQAERYGGRCDDGSDEFIREVERLIDFQDHQAHIAFHSETTSEYCPHCDTVVELQPELMVQTCPHCGKRIVTCSMCRAADANDGKNYCSNCCLCYQAELENKENEA
jgi:predicted RNA-binding Zn-ribbon protein involved in translation (DUF1610 family)